MDTIILARVSLAIMVFVIFIWGVRRIGGKQKKFKEMLNSMSDDDIADIRALATKRAQHHGDVFESPNRIIPTAGQIGPNEYGLHSSAHD